MTSPSTTFFEDLADRGHVSWLEQERGRVRFEIVDEDCVKLWTVAFDDGDITVDRDSLEADAVLRLDRTWFDRAVTGEEKLLPGILRGEVAVKGSYGLAVQVSKLLPGPPNQTGPRRVRAGRRRSG